MRKSVSFHERVVVGHTYDASHYDRTSLPLSPLTPLDVFELKEARIAMAQHTWTLAQKQRQNQHNQERKIRIVAPPPSLILASSAPSSPASSAGLDLDKDKDLDLDSDNFRESENLGTTDCFYHNHNYQLHNPQHQICHQKRREFGPVGSRPHRSNQPSSHQQQQQTLDHLSEYSQFGGTGGFLHNFYKHQGMAALDEPSHHRKLTSSRIGSRGGVSISRGRTSYGF
ncbi:UNVERIFIED_CONTAM: hypothetical protein HDU68_003516 [Siphonaria sp. JEL0065]|nr:hypothetical protein HDU68_003516 [Siphonaria sp. JEL0065]